MSTDLHTLSGAYAIDALSPEEAEEFRTHLAACQVCRDEVRELREAAARMGASEALVPPSALRARVLEAASRQPQQPPRVRTATERKRRWQPRLLVAAVAILVAAVGVGVAVTQRPEQPPTSAAVSRVFNAPDAHQATVGTANGGKVRVATSPRLNEMAVDTDALPQLGDGQVYQIWAVHDGAMTSAAVLSNPDSGAAMEMPEPGTEVAITIEPAGGSAQPTTQPIVTVDPASV